VVMSTGTVNRAPRDRSTKDVRGGNCKCLSHTLDWDGWGECQPHSKSRHELTRKSGSSSSPRLFDPQRILDSVCDAAARHHGSHSFAQLLTCSSEGNVTDMHLQTDRPVGLEPSLSDFCERTMHAFV